MTLYLMTTQDEYELPLMVCDTVSELSRKSGTPAKTISQAICRRRRYGKTHGIAQRTCHPKWHKVEIDEIQEQED